jgi:hypothetical protein
MNTLVHVHVTEKSLDLFHGIRLWRAVAIREPSAHWLPR